MKLKRRVLWIGVLALAAASSGVLLAEIAANPVETLTPPDDESHAMALADCEATPSIFCERDRGAWLGVELHDITAGDAQKLNLAGTYGAMVQEVSKDSPAARAGIQNGDVILSFDGERVRSVAELRRMLRETPPGRAVSIQVSRNGQIRNLSAELEARKGPFGFEINPPGMALPHVEIPDFNIHMFAPPVRLGISGDALTPQLAEYFGVKSGKGVLVSEVESGSAAEKAGLKAGDIIIKAEDTEVGSLSDLRKALAPNPDKSWTVKLTIVRDRREQQVSVPLKPTGQWFSTGTAELRCLGLGPDELRRLKAEIQSHAGELRQAEEELRKQGKQWVEGELGTHAAEMQQAAREIQKQAGQLGREIRRALEERERELKRLHQEVPQGDSRRAPQEV